MNWSRSDIASASADVGFAAEKGEERSSSLAASYIKLVKPWIIALVLITTGGGMFIAQAAMPDSILMFWTLLGVGLATAAAAALNNAIDADIDARMKRTRNRPTASGAVSREAALKTGLVLTFLSMIVMAAGSSPIAASFTNASIFFYVVVYTYCMKRVTPLATYVGGIAGALPPVIGYAAVKPAVDLDAFILFLIVYAWQHPHFWALALKYRHDYAAAGVNNLPVAAGVDETKKQMVVWAAILGPISLLPYLFGMTGLLYFGVAGFTGLLFFVLTLWFYLSRRSVAMSLFFFSILHLSLLYTLLIIDLA